MGRWDSCSAAPSICGYGRIFSNRIEGVRQWRSGVRLPRHLFGENGVPLPLLYAVVSYLGTACNALNALSYASARKFFGLAMTATLSGILGF